MASQDLRTTVSDGAVELLGDCEKSEAQVYILLDELSQLDPDHELCVLCKPLLPDQSIFEKEIDTEVVGAQMFAMWEALKERFLPEGAYRAGAEISEEQQEAIFEQLAAALLDVLQAKQGVTEHILCS